MATVDHRAAIASRKVIAAPAFEWYSWQCLNDADGTVRMEGAIVVGVVQSGKRKGRKRYAPKSERIAFVTDAEMLTERRRFERETGNCAECGGDGQAIKGWDHIKGTSWRQCPLCHGTGKPASVGAVDPVGEKVTEGPRTKEESA